MKESIDREEALRSTAIHYRQNEMLETLVQYHQRERGSEPPLVTSDYTTSGTLAANRSDRRYDSPNDNRYAHRPPVNILHNITHVEAYEKYNVMPGPSQVPISGSSLNIVDNFLAGPIGSFFS